MAAGEAVAAAVLEAAVAVQIATAEPKGHLVTRALDPKREAPA